MKGSLGPAVYKYLLMTTTYKNASYVMAGLACLVLLLSTLFWRMGDDGQSLVPGFHYLVGIAYPALAAWVGILIRSRFKPGKWWTHVPLLILAVTFITIYIILRAKPWWEVRLYLCLAMIIIGYLIPPRELESLSENGGGNDFALLLITSFCFTAISVVKYRFQWGTIVPDHPDMEELLERLLVVTEPLMVFMVVYFSVRFSFSRSGLSLGSREWLQGILWVPCSIVFYFTIIDVFGSPYFARDTAWIVLGIQPCPVYLVAVTIRCAEKATGKTQRSWRDCFIL